MPDFEQPNTPIKNPIPHVALVVDESGSMSGSEQLTVDSINEYITGLRATLPPEARLTVIKFDTHPGTHMSVRITPIFENVVLKDAREVTLADYRPTGFTPLLDAVGYAIERLDVAVKSQPGPVYLGVITDGGENASRKFNSEQIKEWVKARTAQGWTFAFLGVDIDAYAGANNMAFAAGSTVNIDRSTMKGSMSAMSASFGRKYASSLAMSDTEYAAWNSADATFDAEARAKIERKE